MVAGFFFYTAPQFGRTIKVLRECHRKRLHDNDVVAKHQYEELGVIFNHIDREDLALFTAPQLEDVYVEVTRLLEQEK